MTATRDREPRATPARPAGIAGPGSPSNDELALLLEREARLDACVERAHDAVEKLRTEVELREKGLLDEHRREIRDARARLDEELDRQLETRLEDLEARAQQAVDRYDEMDEDTVARLAERAVELVLGGAEASGESP